MIEKRRHRTRLNARNQVTIPAAIVRDLALGPGAELDVSEVDGEVRIRAAGAENEAGWRDERTLEEKLQAIRDAAGFLARPGQPVLSDEELDQAIRDAHQEAVDESWARFLHPREGGQQEALRRPAHGD